jgi:ABC-type bacteriocin/lantibiotic exporter with double-glycine peptidase domain
MRRALTRSVALLVLATLVISSTGCITFARWLFSEPAFEMATDESLADQNLVRTPFEWREQKSGIACGLAAMEMLAVHYNDADAALAAQSDAMLAKYPDGISLNQLKAELLARESGWTVLCEIGVLEDVKRYVRDGHPPVCLIQIQDAVHLVIAIGVNDEKGQFLINDPAIGTYHMDFVTFEKIWAAPPHGGHAMLIGWRDDTPRTETPVETPEPAVAE